MPFSQEIISQFSRHVGRDRLIVGIGVDPLAYDFLCQVLDDGIGFLAVEIEEGLHAVVAEIVPGDVECGYCLSLLGFGHDS